MTQFYNLMQQFLPLVIHTRGFVPTARALELRRVPTPEAVRELRDQLPEMIADPMKFPLSRMEDLRMSGISGGHAAMFIGNRNFALYETKRALITSDEPVIELAENMGFHPEIGALWSAPISVFPLDPHHVLAMFRRDLPAPGPVELTTAETLELNIVIAGSARLSAGGPLWFRRHRFRLSTSAR